MRLRCVCCHEDLPDPRQCSRCGTVYPQKDGLPVLIDFDDSIFRPEDYAESAAGVVTRGSGGRLGRALAALTYGSTEVSPRLARRFTDLLAGEKRVLFVGGGSVGDGLQHLYSAPDVTVVGADVYASPNIDLICDGHKLPFPDKSFDGVVVQAVLEHVLEPHRVVAEIHRVLRRQGLVYAETPFMQQVHEGGYDFTRFTFSGHRWLFRQFDEIEAGQVGGSGTALLWSISYFARSIGLPQRLATLLTAAFFWVRHLERGTARGPGLDAASGFFFLGSKAEKPLRAAAMPGYYEANR